MMKRHKLIEMEFFKITGILPLHPANAEHVRFIRKDKIFHSMATKVFDHPDLIPLLVKKAARWKTLADTETHWALIGYIFYCNENFKKAQGCFIKALQLNPRNLDNWFDLAFSLYHQDSEKHRLAKKILFNFDWCARFFANRRISMNTIKKGLLGGF